MRRYDKRSLKSKLSLLMVGAVLGILIYMGPSIILSILVLWGLFSFINSRSRGEKNILIRIVGIALILRLVFFVISLFVVYSSNDIDLLNSPIISKTVGHVGQLVRDFDREIKNGKQIARYLRGEFGKIPIEKVSHHGFGFLHSGAWTQGILNFMFGESVFNLLLFPIIDLWTIIVIFYLAKAIFDERVATFASAIYAITPSTIIISCTNLRFSLGILSFILIALFLVKFARANNLKFLLMIAVSIILFSFYRDKSAAPLLMIIPFILFMALNVRFRVKFALLAILAFFSIALISKSEFIQLKSVEALQNIISKQTGFVSMAQGNIYKIYDKIDDKDVYSEEIKEMSTSTLIKILLKGLPKGFAYFMFAPFLWQVTNITRFYAYPQILFWYVIIPFAVLGMIKGLILNAKETLPIILLCGYFIVLLSLTMGNEGIAMRYRELVTPFFYIFAGSILCKFLSPPKERDYKAS